MKMPPARTWRDRGSSLIETVIAMGVLAVAIPLVFGALAESGKSGMSSEAETRGVWMVPACMEEIRASREGRPRFFAPTAVNQSFPPDGEVWALAFSPEGKPIGKLAKAVYDKGTGQLNGRALGYIAALSSSAASATSGATPMLRARISIEYPAAAPVGKRRKLDFYTRIP